MFPTKKSYMGFGASKITNIDFFVVFEGQNDVKGVFFTKNQNPLKPIIMTS